MIGQLVGSGFNRKLVGFTVQLKLAIIIRSRLPTKDATSAATKLFKLSEFESVSDFTFTITRLDVQNNISKIRILTFNCCNTHSLLN